MSSEVYEARPSEQAIGSKGLDDGNGPAGGVENFHEVFKRVGESGALRCMNLMHLRILYVYFMHRSKDTGTAWPSIETVCRLIGDSKKSRVRAAIRELEAAQILVKVNAGGGRGKTVERAVTCPKGGRFAAPLSSEENPETRRRRRRQTGAVLAHNRGRTSAPRTEKEQEILSPGLPNDDYGCASIVANVGVREEGDDSAGEIAPAKGEQSAESTGRPGPESREDVSPPNSYAPANGDAPSEFIPQVRVTSAEPTRPRKDRIEELFDRIERGEGEEVFRERWHAAA